MQLDGVSVKRNPVAWALAALALVGPDLYELSDLLVERLFGWLALDDDLEVVLARMLVTLIGFALGALGVQRATYSADKVESTMLEAEHALRAPAPGRTIVPSEYGVDPAAPVDPETGHP